MSFLFIYLLVCVVISIFFTLSGKIENGKIEQMQTDSEENRVESDYKISFCGDGKTFFKIWITNLFLTICTFGIYYPWGRAKTKKYLYSSTYLGEHNFEFHGTGKQMLKGLLKFLAIVLLMFIVLIAIFAVLPELWDDGLSEHLLGLLIYIPYAPILALFIHGSRRYGMAKTSYRGNKLPRSLCCGVVYCFCKRKFFILMDKHLLSIKQSCSWIMLKKN